MKITKISYTRLRATKQFENERIGAEAEIGPREDAEAVLRKLRAFVDDQLGLTPSKVEYDKARRIVDQYDTVKGNR